MSNFFRWGTALLAVAVFGLVAVAKPLATGTARVGEKGIRVQDSADQVLVRVPMSESVPWSVRTHDGPARLIVAFSDLVWSEPPKNASDSVSSVALDRSPTGEIELVAFLREPLAVDQAGMVVRSDGRAELEIVLRPTTAENFRSATKGLDGRATLSAPTGNGAHPLIVALDPGHGGIDPGAQTNSLREADLVLEFARSLADVLEQSGNFRVVLTRNADDFVPLDERVSIARAAGADIFLSIHADALKADSGRASGLTVYTLADDLSETAVQRLTERYGKDDILGGVDLAEAGDDVTFALVDLVRRNTGPRSDQLGSSLVTAFHEADLAINSRPNRHGGFAVLKAADIPSALIELGFLSSRADLNRLTSEDWKAGAQGAIHAALSKWAKTDATWRELRLK